MTAGLDPVLGFSVKTYAEILSDMQGNVRAALGADLVLDDTDPIGQLLKLAANDIAENWELVQASYDAIDPRNAEGELLTGGALMTGTSRLPATRSTVTIDCTLTIGTLLTAGAARVNVAGKPTILFELVENFTAPATAVHSLLFRAVAFGAVEAFAGTLTAITVPVAGWTLATNPLDAAKGAEIETDTALRLRRESELDRVGAANVDAIREDCQTYVRSIYPQGSATCLENTSHLTVDGMAPHSIEVVIYDGTLAPVQTLPFAAVLFATKGAGIRTNGSIVSYALDGRGESHEIRFSRTVQRQVHFAIEATYDPRVLTTPAQVTATVAAVKEALADVGLTRRVLGLDVVRAPFLGAVAEVPGLVDVTRYAHAIGGAPGAGESVAPLVIPRREIAITDTANMVVTLTAAGEL